MSISKELVELTELYKNIQLQEMLGADPLVSGGNKDKKDKKTDTTGEKIDKKKLDTKDKKEDEKEKKDGKVIVNNNSSSEVKDTNTTGTGTGNGKENGTKNGEDKKTTYHGTDRSGRDFDDPEADDDVKGGGKERKPIKQEIKGSDGKVIGTKTINPSSDDYQKAFEKPKNLNTNELPSEVTKGKEKEIKDANTEKKETKIEKQEVKKKEEDYLGKSQGLLGKDDWLKKTSNSPAARSGAFKPEDRWAQQLKHRQWQKDNNRGAFKVDKKVTNSTDGSKVDTPKLKDNKEKATFKRRDQKLLDKGLKPPKYEKDSPTYTTKIGAFLNNKKKGDLKGSNTNNRILSPLEQEMESFDAYDSVMNYLIGTDQVESVEEANYVMMEMDGRTIMEIKKIMNESVVNRNE